MVGARIGVRLRRLVPLATVGVALLAAAVAGAQPSAQAILATSVEGTITPVISDHLREGLDRAERDGYQAYLVELDTPGGLDASMREIVRAFLDADVPVIVFVPPGGRAASAGAIISMAAHVAAMAPGTAIGAATPIDLQGGDLAAKVINDAAAYAESIAEARGRDVGFAVDAVRNGTSISASRAAEIGAVDLVVGSEAELLRAIDGRRVTLAEDRQVSLRTEGADVVRFDLGLFRRFLQWLADPNIAYLFISIGTLAILYELANPGIGAGGITGAIMLLLAFFSLSILPVNATGVLLMVLAAGLFTAELFAPGIGVFAAGGTIALILGGAFLFRGDVGVDPVVLLPTALVAGAGAVVAGRLVWRARKTPPQTGPEALIGKRGRIGTADGPVGQVLVQGTWWRARSARGSLRSGGSVRVLGIEGLELLVEEEGEADGS